MITLFHHYPVLTGLGLLLLLAGLLAGSMLGGLRTSLRLGRAEGAGMGAIESSVFAVFGLLVAFTFTGAADRYTARRAMILEEAQAAQSAWDAIGLLPEPPRDRLRERLTSYLDLKLAAYADLQGVDDLERKLEGVVEDSKGLLAAGVEACRPESGQPFVEIVLPPLSRLREIGLARRTAVWHHPPAAVYLFLIALALVCAFFGGFSLLPAGKEKWIQIAGFSLVIAGAIYLTLDLEFPRMGMLRVDAADAILRGVRDSMK
jgi:hypothetical protein